MQCYYYMQAGAGGAATVQHNPVGDLRRRAASHLATPHPGGHSSTILLHLVIYLLDYNACRTACNLADPHPGGSFLYYSSSSHLY
jgi:hypothetical protein